MQGSNHVLITGITGYIGGSVALAFREAGYIVSGTYRKEEDKQRISAAGMTPVFCDLSAENLQSLAEAIRRNDIIIHAAECDSISLAALLIREMKGSGKTLIYTSGAGYLANHRRHAAVQQVFQEDIPVRATGVFPDRVRINRALLRAGAFGIRSMVMVPAMVYGEGSFINRQSKQLPALTLAAEELSCGVYIGDGLNSWSNVHVDDLAALYLLAAEKAANGTLWYVENGCCSFRQIGEALHQRLGFAGHATSMPLQAATAHWGSLMAKIALSSDCRISGDKARKMLGWEPRYHDMTAYIAEQP